jgi:hypothetical protein
MELITLTLIVVLTLSLIGNFRSWFGRGGGRIRLGTSWFDISRHELNELVNREMTTEEHLRMSSALRNGDTETAEAILAEATLRYLRRKGRIKDE